MPHLLLNSKNLTILISCLALSACSPALPPETPVYCHGWSKAEKAELRRQMALVPSDTALDAEFRDYERVCASLKD